MRLIDADALREYIDAQKWRQFIGCTIGEALKMMVDEQPTIEERKKGEIIIRSNMLDGEECYCSECDHWGLMPDYQFCPYCGADMRGET